MSVEIDHLGIAVRELKEAVRFYNDILGLEVASEETIGSERVHVAMLPTGPEVSSPRIELLEPVDSGSTIARFIEKCGPGLHHIALRVEDLKAAAERVRSAGGRVLNEPQIGAGGHTYVFVHPSSTGGVLLELIQK